MTLARCYLLVLLWFEAALIRHGSQRWHSAMRQWQELRYQLLDQPSQATASHCGEAAATAPPARAPEALALRCANGLWWWRERGQRFDVCADLAAGHHGLGLASPRRYRATMACSLHLAGIKLELPLLEATLFR